MSLGILFIKLSFQGFSIIKISELIKFILLTLLIVNLKCFSFYVKYINCGIIHFGNKSVIFSCECLWGKEYN